MDNIDITQYKHQINLDIDETISSILKHMMVIFESIKFNESQELEETNNLLVLSSTEMVCNKINNLMKIVNLMKADYLKKSEYNYDEEKKNHKQNSLHLGSINKKIEDLQEIHNNISHTIKELKNKKTYSYSLNYN